ncbi:TRAP transporter substrate-binding protein DctP [Agaricicola taiwanensis]|uniref:TRAP transporter substrate-binding protein DctP n=1 Tax=Agaricicola taiwanensis TaxID=591372 RepID=UPI001E303F5D|nr:TRAP transporter substrate-binding protein DctP [Agaricicola taiwanensis]
MRSATCLPAALTTTKRRGILTGFLALAAVGVSVFSASDARAEKFRISLETNPNHVKNITIDKYVEAVKKRIGDKLEFEIYPSSQLYKDRDIPRALRQGAVEMGVPGTWQLDGTDPNFAITSLPTFYGMPEDLILDVTDGPVGQAINKNAEDTIGVKVLGPWMSLGFNHYFMVGRKAEKIEDLKGLKFRIPGGTANARRVEIMGATPNAIPWADAALALQTKVVDGLVSTHESINVAKMWDSGIKYAFEDRQWFSQYVPMVSKRFWDKQDADVQKALVEAWAEVIGQAREDARASQVKTRNGNIENGIEVITASDDDLKAFRQELLKHEQALIDTMKIDPDLVKMAREEFAKHESGN